MSDDNERHGAETIGDLSRPVATTSDNEFSLSIEDAASLYEQAGHPRTARSIQRYCAKGHLDYRRIETPFGDKFLITPASVMRHIAYINDVRPVAASRDMPRPLEATVAEEIKDEFLTSTSTDNQRQGATTPDLSRQVATETEFMSRYVARLENENEFLHGEVTVKNEQIKDLTARGRETNVLLQGLQQMLAPLLPAPERDQRMHEQGEGSQRS